MDNWKRVFAIIWTGQFLSILTSSIVNFAIVLWLSLETGSAEVLAFATMAALLPQSVLGLFTGIFIDRWKRKRVMIMADSFIAFCTLILAVLFYFDLAKISHIYVLLALRSVGSAFHMPAMQASVPLLAPKSELMRIAGINQVIQSVCNIAGPALAGLFITMMKMTNILLLDVAGGERRSLVYRSALSLFPILLMRNEIQNCIFGERRKRRLWKSVTNMGYRGYSYCLYWLHS